jgi:endonuclease/exonuclease/phosphatase family metal-dependent hydrolase
MRATPIVALTAVAATTFALCGTLPADAATRPAPISSVRVVAGPGVGEITVSFHESGAHTTGYQIETGLTTFSKTGHGLPKTGRNRRVFSFSGARHSITLSAAQVASAGAAPATGNHLYFRLTAVNTAGAGTAYRAYPKLQAGVPRPVSPKSSGTVIRVGTFNVRTAKATGDARTWLRRASDVAREISSHNPGVVALQELGPGRADGKNGTTTGTIRQTVSLQKALNGVGAGRYHLVRTTPYVKAGSKHGTQGARILYDTSKFRLLSNCPDTTGKSSYSTSCSVELPLRGGDSQGLRRSAAFAEFQNKSTGKRFFFASMHLDDRHSTNVNTEKKYNALRGAQAAAVYSRISHLNARGEQVIVAGDLNSWQNNRGGNAPHDYYVGKGFYDTAAAQSKINFQYSTINHFAKTISPGPNGYGVAIDVIMVKGSQGARRFENVMKRVDSSRPSDHNLVVSDLVL